MTTKYSVLAKLTFVSGGCCHRRLYTRVDPRRLSHAQEPEPPPAGAAQADVPDIIGGREATPAHGRGRSASSIG